MMVHRLSLLLLVVLEAIIIFFLYEEREDKEHYLAEKTLAYLSSSYNAALQSRDLSIRLTTHTAVLRSDALSAFATGVWATSDVREQADSRARLYRLLEPSYLQLKNDQVLQFDFHTKEGVSFLRFQDSDIFGDDLTQSRPAIKKISTISNPIHGFEVGSSSVGFHFIYPIYLGTQRLGSFEIADSPKTILNLMKHQSENESHFLFVNRSFIGQVKPEYHSRFQTTLLNDAYMMMVDDQEAQETLNAVSNQLKKKKNKVPILGIRRGFFNF